VLRMKRRRVFGSGSWLMRVRLKTRSSYHREDEWLVRRRADGLVEWEELLVVVLVGAYQVWDDVVDWVRWVRERGACWDWDSKAMAHLDRFIDVVDEYI